MEENFEMTFSPDAYKQMGGYVKRCRGVTIRFKIETRDGSRIQEFFAEGRRLDQAGIYKVAFVSEQGIPKKYGSNRHKTGIQAIDALKSYFSGNRTVTAELRNTVIAV